MSKSFLTFEQNLLRQCSLQKLLDPPRWRRTRKPVWADDAWKAAIEDLITHAKKIKYDVGLTQTMRYHPLNAANTPGKFVESVSPSVRSESDDHFKEVVDQHKFPPNSSLTLQYQDASFLEQLCKLWKL
ncbi:hypothetical protein RB195_013397 [Necator americanus]